MIKDIYIYIHGVPGSTTMEGGGGGGGVEEIEGGFLGCRTYGCYQATLASFASETGSSVYSDSVPNIAKIA